MSETVVIPAYGRDYKSAEAAKADWEAGKDFRMYPDGPYLSKRDTGLLKRRGVDVVVIRFARMMDFAAVEL